MIPIADLSYKQSLDIAHKTALIQGEESWTYKQLHEKAHQIAAQLWTDGFLPGDRLLICLENGFDLIVSLLACFRIGVIVVHSYTDYSEAEFNYIAENTGFRGIITTPALQEKMKHIKQPYFLYFSFSPNNDPLPHFIPDLDQPISISYTSGTTAKRKGVIQTYRTIMETMEGVEHSLGRKALERPLVIPSLGSNYAVLVYLLPTLWLGGTVILLANNQIETILKTIEKDRPTLAATYPHFLKQIIHHPQAPKTNFSSLELFIIGGDVVAPELYKEFLLVTKIPLTQGFGMTEAQLVFLDLSKDPKKQGSIGTSTHGVEAKIIGSQEEDLPPGKLGQIAVRRKTNFPGYWNLPEETSKALHNDWLYTGDLGVKDGEGYYWFRGRIKNVIKVEAENVSPLEVEEALCQHPAVKEAGVIGILDQEKGSVVKAFVALKGQATEGELKAFLKPLLAEYKIPVEIVIIDHLPRTVTGKLDRNQLNQL
jgi:acyl-CoA synthetase (AMP-forming)/AMP-acid ligase II